MLTLFIVVIILILAFEVAMFIDALKNPLLSDNEKALWCIGMVFIHPIVALVYYFVAYSNRAR